MIIESEDTKYELIIFTTECEDSEAPRIAREMYYCKHCNNTETLYALAGSCEVSVKDDCKQALTIQQEAEPRLFTAPNEINEETVISSTCKRCGGKPKTLDYSAICEKNSAKDTTEL